MAMNGHADFNGPAADGLRVGLYVDVENLQDAAQGLVRWLVDNWDFDLPAPRRVNLYVQANMALLWEMWAANQFPDMEIAVAGVQRFSRNASKNSADIALALDAVADFVSGAAQGVAVVSDDSDFISLFSKIRELHGGPGKTPFLWIMTDRRGTRSPLIRDFFPDDYLRIVPAETGERGQDGDALSSQDAAAAPDVSAVSTDAAPERVDAPPAPAPIPIAAPQPRSIEDAIADAIIKGIPVGQFKSTDCQPIIKRKWPSHPTAKLIKQRFGQQFIKDILPRLRERGVTEPNPGKKPRRFEMTDRAKRSL